MTNIRIILLFVATAACVHASSDGPIVAFMCNKPAMYRTDKGWIEDHDTDCIKDPVKILEYCRTKFPEKQVTNVVKASKKVTISNWCGFNKDKCHKHNTHEVTPYRCLVGAFQSDALLVPEHCLFDHKHGGQCTTYDNWNVTALEACQERDMVLESFAILQPCNVNLFNGVEFVCCPKRGFPTTGAPVTTTTTQSATSTSAPPPHLVEIDLKKDSPHTSEEDFFAHYLQKSFDERYMNEHAYFMKAKNDLQKHHHERVTKMMKEWAAARQRVQDMNDVDPKAAGKLNREITARFQKTYEALEEEGLAEKKQLQSIHQQRVQSDLNEKKRTAMEHYMDALSDPEADTKIILKKLKQYIKSEQKDRLHTVNHYKHLADTDPKDAHAYRQQTMDHLRIIDQRIQQACDMLNRVPKMEKKIREAIDMYLKSFHEIDVAISDLLVDQVDIPMEEEVPKVNEEKKPVEIAPPLKVEPKDKTDGDYEEYYDEYESDENMDEDEYDDEDDEDDESSIEETDDSMNLADDKVIKEEIEIPMQKLEKAQQLKPTEFDEEVDEDEHDLMPEVMPANMAANRLEVNIAKKKNAQESKATTALYHGYTLGIAVAAIAVFVILVAGIVVLRKKNSQGRNGVNHGFVEIDHAASPEERHVANMQMNGYENPTYKYFETNA